MEAAGRSKRDMAEALLQLQLVLPVLLQLLQLQLVLPVLLQLLQLLQLMQLG